MHRRLQLLAAAALAGAGLYFWTAGLAARYPESVVARLFPGNGGEANLAQATVLPVAYQDLIAAERQDDNASRTARLPLIVPPNPVDLRKLSPFKPEIFDLAGAAEADRPARPDQDLFVQAGPTGKKTPADPPQSKPGRRTMPPCPEDDPKPRTMPGVDDPAPDNGWSVETYWKEILDKSEKDLGPSEESESGNPTVPCPCQEDPNYHLQYPGCPTGVCPYTGKSAAPVPELKEKVPVEKRKSAKPTGESQTRLERLQRLLSGEECEDCPTHPEIDTMEYRPSDGRRDSFDPHQNCWPF